MLRCSRSILGEELEQVSEAFCFDMSEEHRKERVEENILQSCRPLTCSQRTACWFMFRVLTVSGTCADMIACHTELLRMVLGGQEPTQSEDSDTEVLPGLSRIANSLVRSWCRASSNTSSASRAMRLGCINESEIIKQLRMDPMFRAINEIGLVASKQVQGLTVSADGVVCFAHPSNAVDYLGALEIKTRVSEGPIAAARKLQQQVRGRWVLCVLGFRFVPRDHRSQVIHQAAVLGLSFALYVVATLDAVLYGVVILVPADFRKAWLHSFRRYAEELVGWAYKAMKLRTDPEICCSVLL
mmetsp:Transcript_10597/g.29945  ORF Transcript_10597/g.29945 Transcript_10597/m.29945 type:complete len:299 (-) Transcript_10597:353-1249(-)